MKAVEGFQYCGGDTISIVEDVPYCGDFISIVRDIISTPEVVPTVFVVSAVIKYSS